MNSGFRNSQTEILIALWFVLVWPCCGFAPARAEEGAAVSVTKVEIGLDGHFKVGKWTEAAVEIESAGRWRGRLIAEVTDPDGSRALFPGEAVQLAEKGPQRLRCLFQTGRLGSEIVLRVVREEESNTTEVAAWNAGSPGQSHAVEAEVSPALRQDVFLVAGLGQAAGFAESLRERNREREEERNDAVDESLQVVELASAERLPADWRAYDGLDALIVMGDFDLAADVNRAVRQWVLSGGHLVIAVGSDVKRYRQSSLYEWVGLSIPVAGRASLREVSRLEAYAQSGQRLEFTGGLSTAKLRTSSDMPTDETRPELAEAVFRGSTLVAGLEGPLLARVPFGFGRITFLGLDLHRPPVSAWPAKGSLVRRILFGAGDEEAGQGTSGGSRLTHSGITDLASQLHASQQSFPEVRRFSTWQLAGFAALYLALIGPLDYFLVHRVLKRPQWTWVTFPLIVAAAAILSLWGMTGRGGERLRINQVDVVDFDAVSHELRVKSWLTLYSPATRRHHISLRPQPPGPEKPGFSQKAGLLSEPLLSFSGVPEETFEGMYRQGGFEIGRPEYQFAPSADHPKGGARVENLPVSMHSTRSLSGSWAGRSQGLVESDLRTSGKANLMGRLTHYLDAPLENWFLAFRSRLIRPREGGRLEQFPPGRELSLTGNPALVTRELSGYLTSTTVTEVARERGVGAEFLTRQRRYDPLDRDVFSIMRMVTFHETAGGRQYTGLDNDTLRRHDLSPLLLLDRAVLFGMTTEPVSEFALEGNNPHGAPVEKRQATVVRIVMPVEAIEIEEKSVFEDEL